MAGRGMVGQAWKSRKGGNYSMTRPFTCEVYPDWIPDEMLTGDCPDYEPDEQKVKRHEARKAEVKKMVAEMVARAEEKKRRQQEQGSMES